MHTNYRRTPARNIGTQGKTEGAPLKRTKALFLISGILSVLLCGSSASALSITPLGQGVLPTGETMFTVQVTLEPGEQFGWHYHTGKAWGIILSGVLTEDEGCGAELTQFVAGQAFAEEAGRVHNVYNHGSEPVVLLWTEIYPSCLEHTYFVDGPDCEGKSGRSHLVKIPHCP